MNKSDADEEQREEDDRVDEEDDEEEALEREKKADENDEENIHSDDMRRMTGRCVASKPSVRAEVHTARPQAPYIGISRSQSRDL
jgi:hypothetical protein